MAKQFSKEHAGQRIIEMILVAAVEVGLLDPTGKSDDELHDAFLEYVRDFTESSAPIVAQTDYSEDVLKRARSELKKHQYHYAALYYATWVEHWANWHVRCLAIRRDEMTDREIKDMLREVQWRGKLTWLTASLGGKQISQKHLNSIKRLADYRNAFVHHKYPSFNVDGYFAADPVLKQAVESFESTVKYLQNFDRIVIKKNIRLKIKRFAKAPR